MKKLLMASLIAATALAGCDPSESKEVNAPSYDGSYLKIAVIGK